MAKQQAGSKKATADTEPLPRGEALQRLIEQARKDPAFFHSLVFEPEKALGDVTYLDRREKGAIMALRPDDLIAGLAGVIIGPGGMAAVCDYSCHDSCDSTCAAGSCFGTCMSSCSHTCGAKSCDITIEFTAQLLREDAPGPDRRRGFFRPISRG